MQVCFSKSFGFLQEDSHLTAPLALEPLTLASRSVRVHDLQRPPSRPPAQARHPAASSPLRADPPLCVNADTVNADTVNADTVNAISVQ